MPLHKIIKLFTFILVLIPFAIECEMGICGYEPDLMHDLMIVEGIDQSLSDRPLVYLNHLMQGGYFSMPSARMRPEGECGAGFSYVPPYRNYNLRLQLFDRVEVTGNYRVFSGIPDLILSSSGFGDFSDKGANVKIAIMHPEDTNYLLPGIAFGLEDFMGTKAFESRYGVLTYVIPQWNFEFSVGYGCQRIQRWFGGITWTPFHKKCYSFLKDFALVAEYDATAYESEEWEPHPKGRKRSSFLNYGFKHRLWNVLDTSASYIRGREFAFSLSTDYNFGMTKGVFPKIHDPLPFTAPRNTESIGPLRPTDALVQDLYYPFCEQGFDLREVWLSNDRCGKTILRLTINNPTYRYERDIRERLNHLLAALVPSNVTDVIVAVDEFGFTVHEYHYPMKFVRMYAEKRVCPYELFVLSPLCDFNGRDDCFEELFYNQKDLWNIELFPKNYTMFGSAKGKFKYAVGLAIDLNGFLWKDIYYNVIVGCIFDSNLDHVGDVDKLNPSQIINVRTDTVNYLKQGGITVDVAYLEKIYNIGRGFYGRVAGGLFELAYGGGVNELLYYPVDSNIALGFEASYLRKRTYQGIGFTDEIRKFDGWIPTYQKYHGSQCFFNFYYNHVDSDIDLHLRVGRFLAKDFGLRTELARTFPSGMRVFAWYTVTDAKDYVNGSRYYDKGFGVSMPLDIFYTFSSRNRWNYDISAWLRDIGAIADTGNCLYYLIRNQRKN